MRFIKNLGRIVLWLIIVGFACTIVGYFAGGKSYITEQIDSSRVLKDTDVQHINTRYLDDFSHISVDFAMGQMRIERAQDDRAYIRYSGNLEKDVNIYQEGQSVRIVSKQKKIRNNSLFMFDHGVQINWSVLGRLLSDVEQPPLLVLALPEKTFGKVNIIQRFGDLDIADIRADSLGLELHFGSVVMKNVHVLSDITVDTAQGNIELFDTRAQSYEITQSMGEVEFERLDVLKRLYVKNSMGTIDGSVVYQSGTFYNVSANNQMGDVDIDSRFYQQPQSLGKRVEIELDNAMGDINLKAYK